MYVVIAYIVAWLLLTVISLCGDSNLIAVRFLMLIYQTDFFSPMALFISFCMLIITHYLKDIVEIECDENDIHMKYADKIVGKLTQTKSNRGGSTKPHSVQENIRKKAPVTNTRRKTTNRQRDSTNTKKCETSKKGGKVKYILNKIVDYFLIQAPEE